MKNLLTAFEENRHQRIDFLRVLDNSENFDRPHLVPIMVRGVPRNVAAEVPDWIAWASPQETDPKTR